MDGSNILYEPGIDDSLWGEYDTTRFWTSKLCSVKNFKAFYPQLMFSKCVKFWTMFLYVIEAREHFFSLLIFFILQ